MTVNAPRRTVLVTGTGGRSVGSGVLHSLLRVNQDVSRRWRIIAADADPFAWGLYKAEDSLILPLATDPDYIPFMVDAVARFGIDAIIPGTEIETVILAENRAAVEPALVAANKAILMPLMMNKFSAADALGSLGCNVIPTVHLNDWRTLLKKHHFPLIVKPTIGTGGSRGVRIAVDEQMLMRIIETADMRSMPCVQPYLGSADSEFTVGVLSHTDGEIVDSIVLRRKLAGLSLLESVRAGDTTCSVSTGYSQGFIESHPEIQSFCETLALKLGSCGPLNIQLRIAGPDRIPYVLEIHPRFSGTTPIRADAGFNEADLMLRNMLHGERFGRQEYVRDVAAIRAFEHVLVPVSQMLRGRDAQ
jgi:carbamoyl-phosphate synthase large subunit